MTLDPAGRELVDQFNSRLSTIGVSCTDPDEVRRLTTSPLPPPEKRHQVDRVVDLTIPVRGGTAIPVRSYRVGAGERPAIVFFHGGGWVTGDLDSHDGICRRLATATRSVVISVGYRRAPEHPFPIPLTDAVDATAWVASHADALGIDPTKLALAGDSAGGNLAAATAILARDHDGPQIAMQVLIYPPFDAAMSTDSYRNNAEGWVLTAAQMSWYWDAYAPGATRDNPLASLIRHPDLTRLPPAYILTAGLDPLRDDGRQYAERMREAGVSVIHRDQPDAFHGFLGFGKVLPAATRAFEDVVDYMNGIFYAEPARSAAD